VSCQVNRRCFAAESFPSVRTIPYSEFLRLVKENQVVEVAITQDQIQGRMTVNGTDHGKGEQLKIPAASCGVSERCAFSKPLGSIRKYPADKVFQESLDKNQ